jgi:hypothetical protein
MTDKLKNARAVPPVSRAMEAWCRANAFEPGTLGWLANNPPPANWQGTAPEWAFCEMPIWPGAMQHEGS